MRKLRQSNTSDCVPRVNRPAACHPPQKAAENVRPAVTCTSRVVVLFVSVVYRLPPATHTVPPSFCFPAGSPSVPASPNTVWMRQVPFSVARDTLDGSIPAPECFSPYRRLPLTSLVATSCSLTTVGMWAARDRGLFSVAAGLASADPACCLCSLCAWFLLSTAFPLRGTGPSLSALRWASGCRLVWWLPNRRSFDYLLYLARNCLRTPKAN